MKYKPILTFLDIELLKFLIVGVLNTIVGAGVMFFTYNFFGFSYWVSSACNYVCGGLVSFYLNKHFTFRNKSKSVVQISLFILNLIVCYVIAYVGARRFVYYIFLERNISEKDNFSMFCGMLLYTFLNYLGQRYLVFNEKREAELGINENSE